MVLYKHGNITEKNKINKNFKGMVSNDMFNASDAFKKLETHKAQLSPKFEKMISRPTDKNLPSFMQKIYNRLGADSVTDKSLKLNNFSNCSLQYDLYKTNLTVPKKQKMKKDDEVISFDEEDYNYLLGNEEENKINEIKEEKKMNKLKIEVNKIISKMDRLYNNYINSKF